MADVCCGSLGVSTGSGVAPGSIDRPIPTTNMRMCRNSSHISPLGGSSSCRSTLRGSGGLVLLIFGGSGVWGRAPQCLRSVHVPCVDIPGGRELAGGNGPGSSDAFAEEQGLLGHSIVEMDRCRLVGLDL